MSSIIAIMLGRLGMTVMNCLKAYKQMAERAFTPVKSKLTAWAHPAPPKGKFSGESLADAVKDIVEEYADDAQAIFASEACVKT
jgi:hypothetical protein